MRYYKRLYDLRIDNDLTQEEVAKLLNTSKQTYGRYEKGKRKLNIEDLITLAKFYKVSADYILGLTDEKETHWKIKNNVNISHVNNVKNININNK